jgi:hypothetical protein
MRHDGIRFCNQPSTGGRRELRSQQIEFNSQWFPLAVSATPRLIRDACDRDLTLGSARDYKEILNEIAPDL